MSRLKRYFYCGTNAMFISFRWDSWYLRDCFIITWQVSWQDRKTLKTGFLHIWMVSEFITPFSPIMHTLSATYKHTLSSIWAVNAISMSDFQYISSAVSFIIPPANFVCRGYTVFTLSVRASVRPSVTLCFLNNSKSHSWIFIKPCKHVHICKTNTWDKKVRARGQFY